MVPPDFLSQGRQSSTAPAGDAASNPSRQQLRQTLKTARNNLDASQRWQKALLAAAQFSRNASYRRARHIALYFAIGAECPTLPLMLDAQTAGKTLYYPVLLPAWRGRLGMVQINERTVWRRNKYGIPEPHVDPSAAIRPVRYLDMVVMPLVGFDAAGNRLGMGAGYYDRCLEFRRHRRHWRRPLLIGLAYDCQQADRIPAQPWDVPLDGVATESGLQTFNNRTD